jgi:hypothetical protein
VFERLQSWFHPHPLQLPPLAERIFLRRALTRHEQSGLLKAAARVHLAVQHQLLQLDLVNPAEWGRSREYIFGYEMGVADGICEQCGLADKSELAGTLAAAHTSNVTAQTADAFLVEIAGCSRTGVGPFAQALMLGREDGRALNAKHSPIGLIEALTPEDEAQQPGEIGAQATDRVIDRVTALSELVLSIVVSQVERADAPEDTDNWGPRDATIMGYVAGLAQRLCDSEGQPAKAEAVAIRALASFFPVTLHVARLHGQFLEFMNQLDPRFLAGVRAGDEDVLAPAEN